MFVSTQRNSQKNNTLSQCEQRRLWHLNRGFPGELLRSRRQYITLTSVAVVSLSCSSRWVDSRFCVPACSFLAR
jgi:hypothetical protein